MQKTDLNAERVEHLSIYFDKDGKPGMEKKFVFTNFGHVRQNYFPSQIFRPKTIFPQKILKI